MRDISVIIPVYNGEDTIKEAIESVLSQDRTDCDLEIIIVDDGSTDGTIAVIEQYKYRYPALFTIVRQSNAGPATARNMGIAQAAGEFIAFLDADDRWLPGKLKAQLEVFIAEPKLALVGTTMNGRWYSNKPSVIFLDFSALLRSNKVYTSSVLARKTALLAADGFRPGRRLSEDYELWLRIAHNAPVAILNNPYLAYAQGSGASARLWPMEKGELETYKLLFKDGLISPLSYPFILLWSITKHLIRLVRKTISKKAIQ